MPARNKAETKPHAEWSGGVMENVQKRDLVILFAQDEEQSIKKINQFRDVETVADKDYLQSIFVVGVIHRLAKETVSVEPRNTACVVEHPSIENNLERIVNH